MVLLEEEQERTYNYIKARILNREGIWYKYSETTSFTKFAYLYLLMRGTFGEEAYGALSDFFEGTEEHHPWWDKDKMASYPRDVQEWAEMKRTDLHMFYMQDSCLGGLNHLRAESIPLSTFNSRTGEE